MNSTPNIPPHDSAAGQIGSFTPAFPILSLYDPIVRLMSRERVWRTALLQHLQARPNETIVDVGCGTGTFLRDIGRKVSSANLIGVDPDQRILRRAHDKLSAAEIESELLCGKLPDLIEVLKRREIHKVTSSLVLHQVSLAEKTALLAAMFAILAPSGAIAIADYGLQRTVLARGLFRLVQLVDGFEDTQPNADGIIPDLMRDVGFVSISEVNVITTATGSISIYHGVKQDNS
jgi:SAM-dependent methyltransferase